MTYSWSFKFQFTKFCVVLACSVLWLFSLENMFKELSSDVENFVTPDHGCLIGWAKQGLQIIWWFLTKLLLMKYEIKKCFIFLPHPSSVSVLPEKARKPRNHVFLLNCCMLLCQQHLKCIRVIGWLLLNHSFICTLFVSVHRPHMGSGPVMYLGSFFSALSKSFACLLNFFVYFFLAHFPFHRPILFLGWMS